VPLSCTELDSIWDEFKQNLPEAEQHQLDFRPNIILLFDKPLLQQQLMAQYSKLNDYPTRSPISPKWPLYYDGERIMHTPNSATTSDQHLLGYYQQRFSRKPVYLTQAVYTEQLLTKDFSHCHFTEQLAQLCDVATSALELRVVIMDAEQLPGFAAYQAYCLVAIKQLKLTVTANLSVSMALAPLTKTISDCLLKCSCEDYLKILKFISYLEQHLSVFHLELRRLCDSHMNMPIVYYFVSDHPQSADVSNPLECH